MGNDVELKRTWLEARRKQEERIEADREKALKEKTRQDELTSWLETHIDEISKDLGRYYCFEPDRERRGKDKPGSLAIEAIVTDRQVARYIDGERDGERFARNEYEIRLVVISPKKHHGKSIELSAWHNLPGPEPSWIKGSEPGNLVSMSLDRSRIEPKKVVYPLELSIASVNVSGTWPLCVRLGDE